MTRMQNSYTAALTAMGLIVAGVCACQSHTQAAQSQPAATQGGQTQPGQPQAGQGQAGQAAGQGAGQIKILDNPSGGQYAYGVLTSQSNKADALVYMLKQVHSKFGDKPQVGTLFQSRDGNTLATFFSLKAASMGNQPLAGLVIITQHGSDHPEMGILYDVGSRFTTTEPDMLKLLSTAWQGSGPTTNGAGSANQPAPASSGPAPLTRATAGDQSASIGLPAGWRLDAVSGGQLMAEGNHGEMVLLGMLYQGIIDPNNPQARIVTSMPNYSQSPHIICPMSGNLFSAFVNVFNQIRRNNGKPQGKFNLISSTNLQADGGAAIPVQVIFTVDFNDGVGPRKGSARIGVLATRGAPTWAMTVSMTNIPVQYFDTENATMMAVIQSYSQNAQVIGREGAADLARIHQQALANQAQADALNQRREDSNQAFDTHMANLDWQSKVTQDYILDRSVVKATDFDGTATVSNKFADSLVKANPNKFEIVPNAQLIQGRDY